MKVAFIALFLGTSCAKVGYLYRQSQGQLALLYRGRSNSEVLKDPRVAPKHKEKIKKVIVYKKWFYEFLGQRPDSLYEKTLFLESGAAVSYLVIASPYDRIEAKEECFPFVGCFPYIGHFRKRDAQNWAKKLEREGWVTWTRPVYAYSTLGKFNDPILSSFFHYDDEDLAELIFHELFHSIFFVENEVEFNENLADFFAIEMRTIYFNKSPPSEEFQVLAEDILSNIEKLRRRYAEKKNLTRSQAQEILENFLKGEFFPHMRKKCHQQGIDPCRSAQGIWNNARLAAFLTYQRQKGKIRELYRKRGLSLKDFFHYIQDQYERYQKEDPKSSFKDYLFK